MTAIDNHQVVSKIKSTLLAEGLHASDEDLAHLVRKNRLIKDVERLLNEGHSRSEIDKTVKQILKAKANEEVVN